MKRHDLIRTIESFGCVFIRHGAKHDWYRNPNTGVSQPVPRHREINDGLFCLKWYSRQLTCGLDLP